MSNENVAVDTWGTPVYGESNFKNASSLPKGESTFRILPPLHTQKASGKWALNHTSHYGASEPSRKDPKKRIPHPFYCLEVSKWVNGERVIVERCEACDERKLHQNAHDEMKREFEKQGLPPSEVRDLLKGESEWLKEHSRSFQWYMNVKFASGEFKTVKIPNTLKKDIDTLIDKAKKFRQPIDAILPSQGLWFTVTRTGDGFGTEYKAEITMEDVEQNGQFYQRVKMAPLSPDDYAAAVAATMDLSDVGIRRISAERIHTLIESGYDPDVVKAVFSKQDDGEAPEASPAPMTPAPARPAVQASAPAAAQAVQQVAPQGQAQAKPGPSASDVEDKIARARRLMAEAKAAQAARNGGTATGTMSANSAVTTEGRSTATVTVVTPATPVTPTAPAAPATRTVEVSEAEAALLDQFRM